MNMSDTIKVINDYKKGNVDEDKLNDALRDFGFYNYLQGVQNTCDRVSKVNVDALAKVINEYKRGLIGACSVIDFLLDII